MVEKNSDILADMLCKYYCIKEANQIPDLQKTVLWDQSHFTQNQWQKNTQEHSSFDPKQYNKNNSKKQNVLPLKSLAAVISSIDR